MSCLRLLDMWCWVAGQVTWPRHVQHQQRSRGPQARQVAYVVRQVGPSILGAAVTVGWKATTARRVHEAVQWYIYIYILHTYMHICTYAYCVICVYIYRHAQVHVLSMYNVCSVYIYICIRLNYIIYIDSEYLHYTYNTIYTIHSAQYTVQNTQNAIRNMQCARQDITSNTYFRMILQWYWAIVHRYWDDTPMAGSMHSWVL